MENNVLSPMTGSSSEDYDLPTFSLSDTPTCKCTQERIMHEYPLLRGVDSCPTCLLFKKSCPIACHPMDPNCGSRDEIMGLLRSVQNLLSESQLLKPGAEKMSHSVKPISVESCPLPTSPDNSVKDAVAVALSPQSQPDTHVRLCPSQASSERERGLLQLLDRLEMGALMTGPPNKDDVYEIDDYFIQNPVNVSWQWMDNFATTDPLLIEELCKALNIAGNRAVNTTGSLTDTFDCKLWSSRKEDSATGKSLPIQLIGQITGSPHIAVLSKKLSTDESVLRRNIKYGILVMNKHRFDSDLRSCFVDAAIQVG
jgi:hypothetical protein